MRKWVLLTYTLVETAGRCPVVSFFITVYLELSHVPKTKKRKEM